MISNNWPAPNVWVFTAQLVEHGSANADATSLNPIEVPTFFGGVNLQMLKLQLPLRQSFRFIIIIIIIVNLRVLTESNAQSGSTPQDFESSRWISTPVTGPTSSAPYVKRFTLQKLFQKSVVDCFAIKLLLLTSFMTNCELLFIKPPRVTILTLLVQSRFG